MTPDANTAIPRASATRGLVLDIQRFALHDGPGIRTTVFLKGCPLRCVWCHNPESHSRLPQLSYAEDRCTHCLRCVEACPNGAHRDVHGRHVMEWERCDSCGKCVAACDAGALTILGHPMSVATVLAVVLRDAPYYDRSGGGITVSGGEPLAQFEFTLELLRAAKSRGLHTCLDTSGMAHPQRLEAIVPAVDLFLYDYKATTPLVHRALTGASDQLILRNLDLLERRGARVILRCPLVPGVNDSEEHLRAIADLNRKYACIESVEILPYHDMGRHKSARIGPEPGSVFLPLPDAARTARWVEALQRFGCSDAALAR